MRIYTKIIIILLFAFSLSGCTILPVSQDPADEYSPPTRPTLEEALAEYSSLMQSDLPEDTRLTIYYISPALLTRAPVSVEQLMTFSDVKIINVTAAELRQIQPLLKKLDASILQPVQEETYINARLYYVIETSDSNKILEVVTTNILHQSVFVNGVEVENDPIFFDIISPFLTEEDIKILNL